MCHFKCIGLARNVKKAEESKEAKEEGTSARPNTRSKGCGLFLATHRR